MRGHASTSFGLGARFALVAGFGGLLGLMAFAGLDSVHALHQIEARNTRLTQDYLKRHRSLEQIRAALFLSTTYLRDYLLAPTPGRARAALAELDDLHRQMDTALQAYSASVPPDEKALFSELAAEVSRYWSTLTPVMQWEPRQRRTEGRQFLQTQVIPRGTLTLGITGKIDAVHEHGLSRGSRRSSALFLEYRRRMAAILGLTLGAGLLLAGITVARIFRLETESQARYGQLQGAQHQLQQLSARLLEAQEQERRTISRELHDEIGQSLNALLVDLGNLAAIIPARNEEAHGLISTAKRLADQSVKALRDMALLLRPSMLDDFGLVPALHWQAREVSRRAEMLVDVDAEECPDELPEEYRTCVYRVVQEALQNAARHAGAQSVHIAVHQDPNRVQLAIRDDGKGFDADHVRGLGLLGMEERVKHLGGVFEIRSRPGQGTELRIELPPPRIVAANEVI